MFRSPAFRLSLVLMLITVNLLFVANMMGLVPDESEAALDLRKRLSESLALQFSSAADKGDFQTIQRTLRAVVERNDDIRSAAIRTDEGKLIALAGQHLAHWRAPKGGKSTETHVLVPVYRKSNPWATVEIRFAPIWMGSLLGGFAGSFVGLLVFVAVCAFGVFFFIIKRSLRELDPSLVVPERVQKAFDVLQEGVLILDEKEHIVMANSSFANRFDKSPAAMIGLKGSELGWLDCQNRQQVRQLPWFKVLMDGKERKGSSLSLRNSYGRKIKFAVNATAVSDSAGKCRGVLLTFDDITQLEEKNFELADTVDQLRMANEEIQSKSLELEDLANLDPLTLCLNRRSFGQKFSVLFREAKASGTHLSCFMLDIDFFKTVNDTFGHGVGDQVIKAVADILKNSTRESDLVGRYGGEEFCVVMPDLNPDTAYLIAERIRKTIEQQPCSGVDITISAGIAAFEKNVGQPDDLINQADKALYAAKKSGRNRVVTWGTDRIALTITEDEDDRRKIDAPSEKPADHDNRKTALESRVRELEGLLEKRTLELKHYEMYDFKTGLPTRSLFEDRISNEIARAKRSNNLLAVLSVSVETIQRIHATLGHKAAEQLMTECGNRLNGVLRGDIDTVAVVDGINCTSAVSMSHQTEFSILLADIRQVDHVTWVMKRLLDALKASFQVDGNEVYVSAYIGVTIFPHDGCTVEELCRNATSAGIHARRNQKKDRYLFYSQPLHEMAVTQLRIENLLHDAIAKDELSLHFQPKYRSSFGDIAGFEALLRWQSAELGPVSPDRFIPVAEQSGQIDAIGRWVIYNACRQLRNWMDMGLPVGTMAVNLSGIQLQQPSLPEQIRSILEEFNIATHLLEIELTESSLVDIHDNSFAVLQQLAKMGMRISMDDFGIGYSSLAYLKDMPLSCIKIDRSFIGGLDQDENAGKLVASIISMAHELGLEVVAEGVENRNQADYLTDLDCEYLQGYYFSAAVSQDRVADLLAGPPVAKIA